MFIKCLYLRDRFVIAKKLRPGTVISNNKIGQNNTYYLSLGRHGPWDYGLNLKKGN